jgi:GPH family glycoside/pentoside/hexuronide:cation symporter
MSNASSALGVKEKVAYGLGDTASNLFFQAFNLLLFFYYTDVVGLGAAAVGTMMLFTRMLDAVSDPLMGLIADRTNTRWGRFRPYLLWGAFPYGILGYVMFINPNFTDAGKLIYAYVTYSLMWLAYTFVNIPYSALMGVMSPSSKDRTSLSTYRFIFAFTGGFIVSSLAIPLTKFLGGGDQAEGFRYTMGIFAVLSVGLFLYTFRHTTERVVAPREERAPWGRDFRALFANGPWLVLFFAAFLTLTNVALRSGSIVFYFKYVVGDESGFTLFATSGTVAFIAGAFATKLFLRFCNRRQLLIGLTLVNSVLLGAFFFVDPHNTPLLLGLNLISAFLSGPTPAIVWSMYADTADYGEWKSGRRTTGLVFSAVVFAQKMGLAVGSAMMGWILAYFSFVPNEMPEERTVFGIKLVFSLLPAIFSLLSGLAMFAYKLDDPLLEKIETDLEARRPSTNPAG